MLHLHKSKFTFFTDKSAGKKFAGEKSFRPPPFLAWNKSLTPPTCTHTRTILPGPGRIPDIAERSREYYQDFW